MSKWQCANGHVSELDDSAVKAHRFACPKRVSIGSEAADGSAAGGRIACGKPLERMDPDVTIGKRTLDADAFAPREPLSPEAQAIYDAYEVSKSRAFAAITAQPTLRDMFAMAAIATQGGSPNPVGIAQYAYRLADAMIEERKKVDAGCGDMDRPETMERKR